MIIARRFLDHLVNQFFPNHCLLCGISCDQRLICTHCDEALPHLEKFPHICRCCALPLRSAAPFCGHCLERKPAFTRTQVAFSYEYPVDFLIHQFKYRHQLTCGKALGKLFIDNCRQAERPDFLVPAPIHWRKRWLRGFNQTEVLARQLSTALGLPMVQALKQTRYHPAQKSLGRRERQKNLRASLAIESRHARRIRGAHIAVVDDVVTTTATTRALSELLIKAGARQVDVWALARTPDH